MDPKTKKQMSYLIGKADRPSGALDSGLPNKTDIAYGLGGGASVSGGVAKTIDPALTNGGVGTSTNTANEQPNNSVDNSSFLKQKLEGFKNKNLQVTGISNNQDGISVTGRIKTQLPQAGRTIKALPSGARVWSSPYMGAYGYSKPWHSKLS